MTDSFPEGDDPHPEIACPRCGYRLDGEVATWVQQCPLRGRCMECGDALDWSQILAPEKYEPQWSFEHAPSGRLLRTFAATLIRLLRPRIFWTQLKMSDRVRPARLTGFMLAIALVLFALLQVLSGLFAVAYWTQFQTGHVRITATPEIAALPLGPAPVPQRWRALMPRDLPSPWLMLRDGLARPFASESESIRRLDGEEWRIFFDGTLERPLVVMDIVQPDGAMGAHIAFVASMIAGVLALCVSAILPLCFVLLPWTRARCGVRWRHLLRIWWYGLPMPVIFVGAMTPIGFAAGTVGLWGVAAGVGGVVLVTIVNVIWAIAAPVYIFMWWGHALSSHLRLPRPWFVTLLLMILSVLLLPMIAVALSKALVALF